MPSIHSTNVVAYKEVAASWALNNPRVAPGGLSVAARVSSAQARAAYFVSVLADRKLPDGFGACNHCGEVTASWCEGCLIAPSARFATKITRSVTFVWLLALTMPRDTRHTGHLRPRTPSKTFLKPPAEVRYDRTQKIDLPSLKLTASLHPKMDGWNTSLVSFSDGLFSGAFAGC